MASQPRVYNVGCSQLIAIASVGRRSRSSWYWNGNGYKNRNGIGNAERNGYRIMNGSEERERLDRNIGTSFSGTRSFTSTEIYI